MTAPTVVPKELLDKLDEQPPLIPDELTQYVLRKSGQDCQDPRIIRLVSLAAQRFIAEVVHDSLQICKTRLNAATKKQLKAAGYKDKRVLTTTDLSKALKEYGVNVSRAPYYVDSEAKDKAAAPAAPK